MVISVDFDDTCTIDGFPYVGTTIGAQYVLKQLVNHGHHLILHTCRRNSKISYDGTILSVNPLEQALSWFSFYNIPIEVVNTSSKPYADLYIDDRAISTPLIPYTSTKGKVRKDGKFVNWIRISHILCELNIFSVNDYLRLVYDISSDLSLLPSHIKLV